MAPAFNAESRRHSHEYRTKANGAILIFSDNLKFLWARGGWGVIGADCGQLNVEFPKRGGVESMWTAIPGWIVKFCRGL